MALKFRKDIKRSSYYVWFLGAKESKGLRGSEYILPVIKHLEVREKDVEPFKITLQVSQKGLKIIQNVSPHGIKSKQKNETIKHFIPHNTITYVHQHEDVIACILLLFNPVTKCPLHIHAYRCDTLETASLLKQQLQILIDRPENQKKIIEIEATLTPVKGTQIEQSSIESDTGTSTRESESSEERFAVESSRISTLYDSVAAELREKLGKNNIPILLPPRDYDTVHRQKGNLTGIELRRSLNANIVGQNVTGLRIGSSGGSSGFGSEHHPSPESSDSPPNARYSALDNQSTSDEEWGKYPSDCTSYLMNSTSQVTLHRPNRDEAPQSPRFKKHWDRPRSHTKDITKHEEDPMTRYSDNDKYIQNEKPLEKQESKQKEDDKFYEQYEQNQHREYKDKYVKEERPIEKRLVKYFESDGFDEMNRYKACLNKGFSQRFCYEEGSARIMDARISKRKQKCSDKGSNQNNYRKNKYLDDSEYFKSASRQFKPKSMNDCYENESPSLSENTPSDRFKDAKEKFSSMEQEKLKEESRTCTERPISPTTKYRPFLQRHQSMILGDIRLGLDRDVSVERYRNEKYNPKKISALSLVEEEHKKNSKEIAQELKRRSFLSSNTVDNRERSYHLSKSIIELNQTDDEIYNRKKNAAHRHSYAEPKLRMDKNGKRHHELLHRTNSASTTGRVGIASIHPY